MNLRPVPLQRPAEHERGPLLEWVREVAPDLRILNGYVEGARVCAARFTFRGQLHQYAVTANAETPDPDDAIVRTCYRALANAMGVQTAYDGRRSRDLEQEVLAASLRGDTETADRLGRELAVANATGNDRRAAWRSRFGRLGGS